MTNIIKSWLSVVFENAFSLNASSPEKNKPTTKSISVNANISTHKKFMYFFKILIVFCSITIVLFFRLQIVWASVQSME